MKLWKCFSTGLRRVSCVIWVSTVVLALSVSAISHGEVRLTFEEFVGQDGAPLSTYYAGVTFVGSSTGSEWVAREGQYYNVSSWDCASDVLMWSGGSYWICDEVATTTALDSTGDDGIISFDNGDATFVELRYSSAYSLSLLAYNSSGTQIDSDSGPANTKEQGNESGPGVLRVEAPPGELISYIVVHDSGNYWVIDNIRTDASGITTLEIDIDIKPGSFPNCFNNNGNGLITVAVLGASDFDVTQIDTTTLEFGGLNVRVKGSGNPQCAFEDVSGVDTLRIEETEDTLVGEWFTEADPEYSGGTAVYANFDVFDPGAYATFEFVGTGVTWIGARTFNAGLFDWIIDEGTAHQRSGTVNTYIDGVDRFTTELLVDDLAPGHHTFKFVSLGIHGGTMQPGLPSETYIDAFDIFPFPSGEPDGYLDLVCHFVDDDAFGWDTGTGTAELTGYLWEDFGGTGFRGTDSICIVP